MRRPGVRSSVVLALPVLCAVKLLAGLGMTAQGGITQPVSEVMRLPTGWELNRGPMGPMRTDLALAPDGTSLVFAASPDGTMHKARLYRRLLDRADATVVPGTPEGVCMPIFSPDGRSVAYWDCAAIPQELIESELFGHEKGSFTGAFESKKGKFEIADGGTLLLDEVGDMTPSAQAKVLRVIETQEFQRVGGSKNIKVDVRIISATNKDLREEVKKGNFREDLLYRLNVIPIVVPPLRERKEDIPALVEYFLESFAVEYGKKPKKIAPESLKDVRGL